MKQSAKKPNDLRDANRVFLPDAAPLRVPFSLEISPFDGCNFKCNYCENSLPHKRRMLSWDEFVRMTDQARELCQRYRLVTIGGFGEPLLNPRVADMIKYVVDTGLADRTSTITNGSKLTKEMSDALAVSGLTKLVVSVQGISAEKYRQVSGVDIDFDTFVHQIRYFYERRGNCLLHINTLDTNLDPGDDQKFHEIFDSICDSINIGKTNIASPLSIDYDKLLSDERKQEYDQIKSKGRSCCDQIFFYLRLKITGEAYACHIPTAPSIGNINEKPLKEIWNGAEHIRLMRTLLEGKRFETAGCKDCYELNCGGELSVGIDENADKILKRLKDYE